MPTRPTVSAATLSGPVPPAAPAGPATPPLFQGAMRPLYPAYRSVQLWSDADGLRMSAAMSFYGMFSLAPLLLIIVALLGYVIDRQVLETTLVQQIHGLVGAKGAAVIEAALASAREPGQGVLASALAFVLLVVGATGVFAELQSALERLWTQGTGTAAADAWWHGATLRLRGVAYVLAFGFLMLVSLVISSVLSLLQTWAGGHLQAEPLLAALNLVVSWAVTTALFVALMRMSAGPQPRLRHLVAGAAIAAVLFGVGKYVLALYLATAAVMSAYGAAGSMVVLLMWIYFASAVLLYGASCARVLAERRGEFAPGATPPPAAAVTAVQAEARRASGTDEAPSTATVAAVLSDMTGAPAGQARAGQPVSAPNAFTAKDLAGAALACAAVYALLRPRKGQGGAAPAGAATDLAAWADGWRGRASPTPPAPGPERARTPLRAAAPELRRAPARGLGWALLTSGALRHGARWLWQGVRVARRGAEIRRTADRVGLGRAAHLAARVGAWRDRYALARARHDLHQDMRALRSALRRRR